MPRFERGTGAIFTQHDHLGGDAQGDFVRGFRTEIEADGRMYLTPIAHVKSLLSVDRGRYF